MAIGQCLPLDIAPGDHGGVTKDFDGMWPSSRLKDYRLEVWHAASDIPYIVTIKPPAVIEHWKQHGGGGMRLKTLRPSRA